MAARINNFPVNVIYDRTRSATVSYAYSAGVAPTRTTTGTKELCMDKDMSTFYQEYTASTDASAVTTTLLFDYGKQLYNVIVATKYVLGVAAGVRSFDYSTDNISWTALNAGVGGGGGSGGTLAYMVPNLRYLRYYIAANVGADSTTQVYELSVMGAA